MSPALAIGLVIVVAAFLAWWLWAARRRRAGGTATEPRDAWDALSRGIDPTLDEAVDPAHPDGEDVPGGGPGPDAAGR